MKQATTPAIKLNQFGQVDTEFYIQQARVLRNKAITEKVAKVAQQVKALMTPETLTIGNIKAA